MARGKPQAAIPDPVVVTSSGRVRTVSYLMPEARTLLHQRAKAAGMSLGDYIAELARRDEVDDDGRPVWVPKQDEQQLEMTA